jgi:hypothetical protein
VVGVHGLHLKDAWVVSPRGAVGTLYQLHTVGEGRFGGRGHDGIQIVAHAFVQIEFFHFAGPGGDRRRHARRFADFLRRQVVAISVAGAFPRNHPHAHAHANALRRALYHRFVDADGACQHIFKIQVGVIATRR